MPILLTNQSTGGHGGIQRYVARLAAALAAGGAEVTLIEPSEAPVPPRIAGVRRIRYPVRGALTGVASAALMLFGQTLRRRREPVIASIWFPSALAATLVPRALRGPLAVLAHGTEIAPGRSGLRARLMRRTFASADVVLANSTMTRDLLARAGVRRPVDVVFCGVDAPEIARTPSPAPVVLSVGRLIARKGFDRTIEALPAVLAAVPEASYRLVGDGPLRAELEALAARLGVADRVHFLGAIDDAATAREYASATCFAMPCRRIGDDVEGFGIVYLEAAVARVPSIGGRGSGADDAIEDGSTGLLVDGDDVAEIARALATYLREPERARADGERARARAVERFTWPRIAARVLSALDDAGAIPRR